MTNKADDYFNNLVEYYSNVDSNTNDHSAVKWGSKKSQWLRFKILSDIDEDFFASSLLDLGCGVGHMTEFLQQAGFSGSYLGVDMLSDMVVKARNRYQAFSFDVYQPNLYSFGVKDYCIASGIFTTSNEIQMQEQINRMFSYASKGLAFNSLSSWALEKSPNEFNADPIKVLDFCSKITSKVVLRHDYLPHDFTVYMYK